MNKPGPSKPAAARKGAHGAGPPRVGQVIHRLRKARKLSLEELGKAAGVSKSMLSQIESEKANPTVAMVWRIATALRVGLEEILGSAGAKASAVTLMSAHETPELQGAEGMTKLRILGPLNLAGSFEWYELTIEPGGALPSEPHSVGATEHLTVLHGALDVESGGHSQHVRHGETVRYAADVRHAIRNTGKVRAVAVLVVINP